MLALQFGISTPFARLLLTGGSPAIEDLLVPRQRHRGHERRCTGAGRCKVRSWRGANPGRASDRGFTRRPSAAAQVVRPARCHPALGGASGRGLRHGNSHLRLPGDLADLPGRVVRAGHRLAGNSSVRDHPPGAASPNAVRALAAQPAVHLVRARLLDHVQSPALGASDVRRRDRIRDRPALPDRSQDQTHCRQTRGARSQAARPFRSAPRGIRSTGRFQAEAPRRDVPGLADRVRPAALPDRSRKRQHPSGIARRRTSRSGAETAGDLRLPCSFAGQGCAVQTPAPGPAGQSRSGPAAHPVVPRHSLFRSARRPVGERSPVGHRDPLPRLGRVSVAWPRVGTAGLDRVAVHPRAAALRWFPGRLRSARSIPARASVSMLRFSYGSVLSLLGPPSPLPPASVAMRGSKRWARRKAGGSPLPRCRLRWRPTPARRRTASSRRIRFSLHTNRPPPC